MSDHQDPSPEGKLRVHLLSLGKAILAELNTTWKMAESAEWKQRLHQLAALRTWAIEREVESVSPEFEARFLKSPSQSATNIRTAKLAHDAIAYLFSEPDEWVVLTRVTSLQLLPFGDTTHYVMPDQILYVRGSGSLISSACLPYSEALTPAAIRVTAGTLDNRETGKIEVLDEPSLFEDWHYLSLALEAFLSQSPSR